MAGLTVHAKEKVASAAAPLVAVGSVLGAATAARRALPRPSHMSGCRGELRVLERSILCLAAQRHA